MTSNAINFITKSKQVHGDKYDYHKVEYINCGTKVLIICPIHGEFSQRPNDHTSKKAGCPSCSGNAKGRTSNFIDKAKLLHDDKYTYDKVDYLSCSSKVVITCPEHGDFSQRPNDHISKKAGCPVCSGNAIVGNSEFISRAKLIHRNKYSYEKVNYLDSKTKLVITCPTHGDFKQAPYSHLRGANCPTCKGKHPINEDFICKAQKVHGNTYKYDKVQYSHNHAKVVITCKQHGDFEQSPSNHLKGRGCSRCDGDTKRTTVKDFVINSKLIHGDKYQYSNVEYRSAKVKCSITCSVHGDFEQKPNCHLSGQGCPKCADYGFSKEKFGTLYYTKLEFDDKVYYKIGITNRETKTRMVETNKNSVIIFEYKGTGLDCYNIEQEILNKFKHLIQTEHKFSGSTECFTVDIREHIDLQSFVDNHQENP